MNRSLRDLSSLDDAAARSGTYQLLARLWLREADNALVSQLRAEPLSESFVAAGGLLPAGEDVSTIEQLAIDYCQIFVGPRGHLPPYQSIWNSSQFQGKTVVLMKAFVEIVGYDAERSARGVMLDHLGVQLGVMGHLLQQVATWGTDAADYRDAAELARSFFAAHLDWPTELLSAATDRASTDFYRSMVTLTRGFLNSEMGCFHA